jgi:DNA-binding MarR family transcriptional regulator
MLMNDQPSGLAVTAWTRLIRAQQVLLERVEADLTAAQLPPLGWYDVLLELQREKSGRLRQFELCERVLLSKYNLSRLLDRLEEAGFVKRRPCKEDRRGAIVAISASGRALQKKMWPVYRGAIEHYFAKHLSQEDAEYFGQLLARLITAARLVPRPDSATHGLGRLADGVVSRYFRPR